MSDFGYSASATPLPKIILPVKAEKDDRTLSELLRRCPPGTLEAARRFRMTHNQREVQPIIEGVITRYVDRDKRVLMVDPRGTLRLSEDLAIDSLSMIEISMTLEDVLEMSLPDEKLRSMKSLRDIMRYAHSQFRSG